MNTGKSIEEVSELIAIRVKPGDRWKLTHPDGEIIDGKVIDGILEAMSEYMRQNNYIGDYRLAPLLQGGRLYAIKQVEVELPAFEPKKYDLYGEF